MMYFREKAHLDLGAEHWLQFTGLYGAEGRHGAIVGHLHPDSSECVGSLTFDTPEARENLPDRPRWTVEVWEPLTLSPSVLRKQCGDHGFIRQGQWVGV